MNQVICNAIRDHNRLSIIYDWRERVVEPHCYGINHKDHELLRAYQLSMEGESRESPGWKLFRVDDLQQIAVLEDRFSTPRPGYDRDDPAMNKMIFCGL